MKDNFIFECGDEVVDMITGFSGVIIYRTQWMHNCNTYGVKSRKLKDGKPQEREQFDEPQLKLKKKNVFKAKRDTGGPSKPVIRTNRM